MAAEKVKVDYNKLTVEQLAEYYNTLSDELKKEIDFNDYMKERPAKTALVDVIGADGKPQYYIDKNGVTRVKRKKIAVGTAKESYFNLMAAKYAFYQKYKNEFVWITKPVEKAKKDNIKDEEEKKRKNTLSKLGIKM